MPCYWRSINGSPLADNLLKMFTQLFSTGTLVDWHQTATHFPKIPDVEYPQIIQQPAWFDYGPKWLNHGFITKHPPGVLRKYKVLVPRCDAESNALGCLSPPEVTVPVATYTGWNLRSKAAGAENELVSLREPYLPFALTKAERERTVDPRLSLQERYGSLSKYLNQLRNRCEELQAQRYLLQEDVERIVSTQESHNRPLFKKFE